MRSRRELAALAEAHGVPLRKTLKLWVGGELRTLEVDVPAGELAEELRSRGAL